MWVPLLLPACAVLTRERDGCWLGDLYGTGREELPRGASKSRLVDLMPRSCIAICNFLLVIFLIIKKKFTEY